MGSAGLEKRSIKSQKEGHQFIDLPVDGALAMKHIDKDYILELYARFAKNSHPNYSVVMQFS